MEKPIASNWTIAWKHYLLAGLVMPLSVGILILGVGAALISAEGMIKLILILLTGTSRIQNTLLFYLPWLAFLAIVYFSGTRWSTEVIEKKYRVSDREKAIRLATLLLFIETVLLVGWNVSQAPSPVIVFDALIRIAISVGFFYVISKQFFLVEVTWDKFSVAILLITIGAMAGTVYLINSIQTDINRITTELTNRTPPTTIGSIRQFDIVPIGNPSQMDLLLTKEILQEDFPGISINVNQPLEAARTYDSSRDSYAAELLTLSLASREDRQNMRVIGLTNKNLYAISEPANNFVVSGAFPNGKAIIVSVFHLKGSPQDKISQKIFRDRLRKSLRASLGTSFGLDRRSEKECVMSIAKTMEELDAKGVDWCNDEAQVIQRIIQVGQ